MKSSYEFKCGQRIVKKIDTCTESKGSVEYVTDYSVFIRWDGEEFATEYYREEFGLLNLAR